MDHEETLGHLLGFVGRPVTVLFAGAGDEPPDLIGLVRGVLVRGDRDPAFDQHVAPRDETLFFYLDGPAASFALSREEFVSGGWVDSEQRALAIEIGRCQVTVILDEARDAEVAEPAPEGEAAA